MGGLFSTPKVRKPKTRPEPEEESEEAKMRERARRRQQKMLSTNIFAGKGQLSQPPVSRPTVTGL